MIHAKFKTFVVVVVVVVVGVAVVVVVVVVVVVAVVVVVLVVVAAVVRSRRYGQTLWYCGTILSSNTPFVSLPVFYHSHECNSAPH